MTREDRALAFGLIAFFILITVVVLLYTMLNPAASALFDVAGEATSNADAQSAIDEREQIWGLVMLYGVFLGAVFLIGRSVIESRRGL